MRSCPGDPGAIWTLLKTRMRLYDTMGHQNTWYPKLRFSLKSTYVNQIAAVGPHVQSLWWADMDLRGKSWGLNRECFIWKRFGHLTFSDKGSGPHMREDHSKLETCRLEERASPHVSSWHHWGIPNTSKHSKKTRHDHGTWKHLILEVMMSVNICSFWQQNRG